MMSRGDEDAPGTLLVSGDGGSAVQAAVFLQVSVGTAHPKAQLLVCPRGRSPTEMVALPCRSLHPLCILDEQDGRGDGSSGRHRSIPKE